MNYLINVVKEKEPDKRIRWYRLKSTSIDYGDGYGDINGDGYGNDYGDGDAYEEDKLCGCGSGYGYGDGYGYDNGNGEGIDRGDGFGYRDGKGKISDE